MVLYVTLVSFLLKIFFVLVYYCLSTFLLTVPAPLWRFDYGPKGSRGGKGILNRAMLKINDLLLAAITT